ncbi:MAG: energy transducer TonB [Bacteroidia bacterium]
MNKNRYNIIYALILLGFLVSFVSNGQDTAKQAPVKPVRRFTPLPLVPRFPGGRDSLAAFLKKNTRYPAEARKKHITGTIEVDFWVDEQGKLSKIHVLKPLGYGCDTEAVRVVKMMPRWKPGMRGRIPMAMDYHVNITFGEPEKK